MAYLVLVRHGLSEYNAKGIWTGWADPPLTQQGITEARHSGKSLSNIHFDLAITATFQRTKKTLAEIKKVLNQQDLKTIESEKINERNYGIYTGRKKWEVEKELGKKEFHKLRRNWDYPIPEGESLKQVSERLIPFYKENILPPLKMGKNVLVVSSGNALRTLVKYLENISDQEISNLEFGIGEDYIYHINKEGKITHKEIRNKNPLEGKQ